MESEIGGQLFRRGRNGTRLTDVGGLLLDQAGQLVRSADEPLDDIRRAARKQLGTTVVTTCSAANVDYVRDLGADEVIDHRTENVFERARQIAGLRPSQMTPDQKRQASFTFLFWSLLAHCLSQILS